MTFIHIKPKWGEVTTYFIQIRSDKDSKYSFDIPYTVPENFITKQAAQDFITDFLM